MLKLWGIYSITTVNMSPNAFFQSNEEYNTRWNEIANELERKLREPRKNESEIRWIIILLKEEYPQIFQERQELIHRAQSAIWELHRESITWTRQNPDTFRERDGRFYVRSWTVRIPRENQDTTPIGNSFLKLMRKRIEESPSSKSEISNSIIQGLLNSDWIPLASWDNLNEVNKLTSTWNKIEWYWLNKLHISNGGAIRISWGKVYYFESRSPRRKIEVGKVVSWFWGITRQTTPSSEEKRVIPNTPVLLPAGINAYSENQSPSDFKKTIEWFKLENTDSGIQERKKLALWLIARHLVLSSIKEKKTLSFQVNSWTLKLNDGTSVKIPWIQEGEIHEAVTYYFLGEYFKDHYSSESLYAYFATKLTNSKQNYEKLKQDLEDGDKVWDMLNKSILWINGITSYLWTDKLKDIGIMIKTKMFLNGNANILTHEWFVEQFIPENMRANWDKINPAAKGILIYGALIYGGFKLLSALWDGTIGKYGWIKTILWVAWLEVIWHLVMGYSPTEAGINGIAWIFSGGTDEKKFKSLKGNLQSVEQSIDLGNYKWLALGLLSQSNNFSNLSWIESGNWEEYQNKSIEMICQVQKITKAELRKKIEEGRDNLIGGIWIAWLKASDIEKVPWANFWAKMVEAIHRADVISTLIRNNSNKGSENDFRTKFSGEFKQFIKDGKRVELDLAKLLSQWKIVLENTSTAPQAETEHEAPTNTPETRQQVLDFINQQKFFANLDDNILLAKLQELASRLHVSVDAVKALVKKQRDEIIKDKLWLWYSDTSLEMSATDLEKVEGNSFLEKLNKAGERIQKILVFKNSTLDNYGIHWSQIREKFWPSLKEFIIKWTPQQIRPREVLQMNDLPETLTLS